MWTGYYHWKAIVIGSWVKALVKKVCSIFLTMHTYRDAGERVYRSISKKKKVRIQCSSPKTCQVEFCLLRWTIKTNTPPFYIAQLFLCHNCLSFDSSCILINFHQWNPCFIFSVSKESYVYCVCVFFLTCACI